MKKINYGLIPVCLMMFFAALLIQPKKASAEEDLFYTYTYDYWGIER